MYKNKHIKIFILLLFISLGGFSQTTFNSPFSLKGIGDLPGNGFPKNSAMGGITIGLRDPGHIDFTNPASYSVRDSLSFVFNFGAQGKASQLTSANSSAKTYDLNFNHLAFSFPITRHFGVALGFVPSSYIGYTIKETVLKDDPLYNPQIGELEYLYHGEGGITRFFVGSAIELFDHLSVGANFDYLFGEIKKTHALNFLDNPENFNTKIERRIIVSDFNFDIGLQYETRFAENKHLVIGLTGGNSRKINFSQEKYNYAVLSFPNGSTFDDTISSQITYDYITLPYYLGVGISFSNGEKWLAGIDYSRQDWSKVNIPFSKDTYTTAQFIRAGFQFTPNPRDFRRYWKIIKYRFGGHVGNSYFKVNNNAVKDFGISFGVGLPIIMTRSFFNVSIETGWRGSKEKNYLEEHYNIINFGLSINDFWFIKRKYK